MRNIVEKTTDKARIVEDIIGRFCNVKSKEGIYWIRYLRYCCGWVTDPMKKAADARKKNSEIEVTTAINK